MAAQFSTLAAVSCTFCQIAEGRLPGHVVFEDSASLAFLDRRPLFPGHCLLVPRRHYETLPDLPPDLVGPLFERARLLARVIETAMDAEGTFVALNNRVSQSVPHLHIHIVPRRRRDGLRGFFWPRNPYRDEGHMREVCELLRSAVREYSSGT